MSYRFDTRGLSPQQRAIINQRDENNKIEQEKETKEEFNEKEKVKEEDTDK